MSILQELMEMEEHDSFESWKKAMVDAGATEFIQEDEFNKNHVYALKDDRLIGLWDRKKKKGLEYAGKGMRFSKGRPGRPDRRKLKKLDMKKYMGEATEQERLVQIAKDEDYFDMAREYGIEFVADHAHKHYPDIANELINIVDRA